MVRFRTAVLTAPIPPPTHSTTTTTTTHTNSRHAKQSWQVWHRDTCACACDTCACIIIIGGLWVFM